MSNHGTASVSGAYIEFQAAVFKALPREIDDAVALDWAQNGEELTQFLSPLRRRRGETGDGSFLRLISEGESLVLDETDGTGLISCAADVFPGGIDPDFVNWSANEPSGPTRRTPVAVYELSRDATFAQMLGSASDDPNRPCLAQSQIVGFVKKYRSWLRTDGYGTFFLFKSAGEFFVAYVRFIGREGLYVGVLRFGHDYVWNAEFRRRIVLPQL